jgi:hypothetical protein
VEDYYLAMMVVTLLVFYLLVPYLAFQLARPYVAVPIAAGSAFLAGLAFFGLADYFLRKLTQKVRQARARRLESWMKEGDERPRA